jgi:pyruvate,orthophosphate dikinase
VRAILEKHFKDVQDIEFTIQEGKLFMLQTRNGKRTAAAALKFSIDMVREKLIDWKTAILRNPADQLEQLLAPIFDLGEIKKARAIATGLPAGPGAATGRIYFNAERAVARCCSRREGSSRPHRDLPGGSPRHDRRRRHPHGTRRCLLPCRPRRPANGQGLRLRRPPRWSSTMKRRPCPWRARSFLAEGDFLSIDGTSGTVYAGQIKTAPSEIIAGLLHNDSASRSTEKFRNYSQLMKWCSQATRLSVRTNADTPEQTQNAIAFGAVGIGLTRTEHMFFEGNRIDAMREMILAEITRRPQGGSRQASALPARRLPWNLQGAQGIPGNHPFPRSTLARIPAADQGAADGSRPKKLGIPVEKDHASGSRTA